MRQKEKPPITEAEFMRQVLELAALRGWRCWHQRPARTSKGWRSAVQGKGANGFPDVVAVRSGVILFIETKTETGRLTPDQKAWAEALSIPSQLVWHYVWRPSQWKEIERILF